MGHLVAAVALGWRRVGKARPVRGEEDRGA
jgi:hypothetical protein